MHIQASPIVKTASAVILLCLLMLGMAGIFEYLRQRQNPIGIPPKMSSYPLPTGKIEAGVRFRMLLTSAGLSNTALKKEFFKLTGKDGSAVSVACIITAAEEIYDPPRVKALRDCFRKDGIGRVSVVDLRDPIGKWLGILKNADVIWVAGGNTYYLLYWTKKSGLDRCFHDLLENKVYVGVSAGSILAGPDIASAGWDVGVKDVNHTALTDFTGLHLVGFSVFPHYENGQQKDLQRYCRSVNYPMVAIGNGCAVEVNRGKARIFGDGPALLLDRGRAAAVRLVPPADPCVGAAAAKAARG